MTQRLVCCKRLCLRTSSPQLVITPTQFCLNWNSTLFHNLWMLYDWVFFSVTELIISTFQNAQIRELEGPQRFYLSIFLSWGSKRQACLAQNWQSLSHNRGLGPLVLVLITCDTKTHLSLFSWKEHLIKLVGHKSIRSACKHFYFWKIRFYFHFMQG